MESAPDAQVSPRADLISALLWIAFGGAVAIGAWRMDRLENLHINPYEVPGLVPGILGAAIVLLGLVLAVRALRQGALRPVGPRRPGDGASPRFMVVVIASMLAYSVVLVGHGIPFWLATLLFVSGFIFFFDGKRQAALGRGAGRRALLALAYGAVASAIVSLGFQEIFYVRLP